MRITLEAACEVVAAILIGILPAFVVRQHLGGIEVVATVFIIACLWGTFRVCRGKERL
jgi:hypothetical protein